MYYPLQIPSLLDENFKENINYCEYHNKALEKCIMCLWTMQSKSKTTNSIYNIILPDGCIDLIVDFTKKQIFFCGFSHATEFFKLTDITNFMGIRFRPGAFYTIYKLDSTFVMDNMLSYKMIEKDFNLNTLFSINSKKGQIDFLWNYLYKKTEHYEADIFEIKVHSMYLDLHEKCIEQIAKDLSYSKRHLGRLFYKHFGINPKTMLNILRLHKSLSLLLYKNTTNLTELAIDCGFFDQSHFTSTIKKYCGISPTELINRYKE